MPAEYTRCPFSYGCFFGTALLATYLKRQSRNQSSSAADINAQALPICEVVFVLGGPGAGKGTQCQLLEERLPDKWVHLSAGDLLRAERKIGGPLGDLINSKIANGEICPSSITVKCIENAMARAFHDQGTTKFIIDGFPRSKENMSAWEEGIVSRHHTIKFVLDFECPEEVLVGRLLARGKDSGRSDDNIEVIRKRFHTHQESAVPMIGYFMEQGTKVHKIDSAMPVENVYDNVKKLFQ